MLRRVLRSLCWLGLLAGAAAVAGRVVRSTRQQSEVADPWPPVPPAPRPAPAGPPAHPAPAATRADTPEGEAAGQGWVTPEDGGSCPLSHPVKAKLSSGVYHLPGMSAYQRTKADRCYPDEETAGADGLRKAKR
ncbi:MAG: hypothetical protein ACRDYD_06815 [Acidimicrobiales bacterium]